MIQRTSLRGQARSRLGLAFFAIAVGVAISCSTAQPRQSEDDQGTLKPRTAVAADTPPQVAQESDPTPGPETAESPRLATVAGKGPGLESSASEAEASAQPQQGGAAPEQSTASASEPAAEATPSGYLDLDPDLPRSQFKPTYRTMEASGRDFSMIHVLPKDAILAEFEPAFVTGEEADEQTMPGDLVIGLSINGDHRAYPVPYLSGREIVNDVVGGKPVAVTW